MNSTAHTGHPDEMEQWALIAKRMELTARGETCDAGELHRRNEIRTFSIGFHGMAAAAFDILGLEELIDRKLGKTSSNFSINSGAMVKSMVMQLLSSPYQTVYRTGEYFAMTPLCALLNADVQPRDLGRTTLSRLLDAIADYDPRRLFTECASQVCTRLGVNVSEVHVDSTSFHMDGEPKQDDMSELKITHGYSRDHRPDLPQVILLGLVDGITGLPVYSRSVSGSVNDKTSFFEMIREDWPMLAEMFDDLKYLVGDSALFTADILAEARKHGLHVVSRVPDKLEMAQECFDGTRSGEPAPIYVNEPDGPVAAWCGTAKAGETTVRLMLVSNGSMRESKMKTARRRAAKELNELGKKLRKLRTSPAKCRADAEKNADEIIRKCRFCKVEDLRYEDVLKYRKPGRPKKNAPPEDFETVAVRVYAVASVDEDRIEEWVASEIRYVIATTDTKRKWKMNGLLETYMRQSVIERAWRTAKDPSIMLDAIYLKTPRRITALMWIMSLSLLVHAAIEYRLRQAAPELNLHSLDLLAELDGSGVKVWEDEDDGAAEAIASTEELLEFEGSWHRDPEYGKRLTLRRLKQYMLNSNIQLTVRGRSVEISGVTDTLKGLLFKMGPEWCRYYMDSTYTYENVTSYCAARDEPAA